MPQTSRSPRPTGPSSDRDGGPVVVPDELAGEVLRALIRDLTKRVPNGGTLSPAAQRLLYALDAADRRHTAGSAPGTTDQEPVRLTLLTASEAAERLECSATFVRRLARRGLITGRRTAAGWLIEPTSLDDYRMGRRTA